MLSVALSGADFGSFVSMNNPHAFQIKVRSFALSLLLIQTAMASACDEKVDLDNVGGLCIYGSESENGADLMTFGSGTAFDVAVVLAGVGGCTRNIEASCSVKVQGDEIRIHAHGSYVDTSDPNKLCPAVVYEVLARCHIPKLQEGSYTIRYGDADSVALTIPSASEPIVVGDRDEAPCLN
jgi:hypothetical protein